MGERILAFDPGSKYTGWALLTDKPEPYVGVLRGWQNLEDLFDKALPSIVVCEDYRLFPNKAVAQFGSQFIAIRMIGVIEFLCWKRGITFVEQAASRIRRDPLVKDLKFHKSKHANDAAKHALSYKLKVKGGYRWKKEA